MYRGMRTSTRLETTLLDSRGPRPSWSPWARVGRHMHPQLTSDNLLESPMFLETLSDPEPGFLSHVERFIKGGERQFPTRAEASILLAAAGNRLDQQCVARYAVGMVWLSWYYAPAWSWLTQSIEQCAPHVNSVTYLHVLQMAQVLKQIPLQERPRSLPQRIEHLIREAEMIIYLRTGRWTQPVSLP